MQIQHSALFLQFGIHGGFLKAFLSHLVGTSEQFGIHEKLSWGVQAAGLLTFLCRLSSC